MKFTPNKLNLFLLKELPSAYLCGVRVYAIEDTYCTVRIKHKWFNQNPFQSMYFAVQNMGAELTTGALVMKAIKESNKKVSMLVLNQKSQFTKKRSEERRVGKEWRSTGREEASKEKIELRSHG